MENFTWLESLHGQPQPLLMDPPKEKDAHHYVFQERPRVFMPVRSLQSAEFCLNTQTNALLQQRRNSPPHNASKLSSWSCSCWSVTPFILGPPLATFSRYKTQIAVNGPMNTYCDVLAAPHSDAPWMEHPSSICTSLHMDLSSGLIRQQSPGSCCMLNQRNGNSSVIWRT
jgi:hypothetical protein